MDLKVLSFAEFFNLTFLQKNEYVKQIDFNEYQRIDSTCCLKLEQEMALLNWYYSKVSQPFKQELITELFEGWKLISESGFECIYENNQYQIEINKRYSQIGYFVFVDDGDLLNLEYEYYIPRTLDDFINDCQRAGINLERRI